MPTNTLRPDGAAWGLSAGSVVPSGTLSAAISDNSDSTYAVGTASQQVTASYGTFTLPAGAVVISATPRFRLATPDGSAALAYQVYGAGGTPFAFADFTIIGATPTTYTAPTSVTGPMTQAQIDGMMTTLANNGSSQSRTWHHHEAYVDVLYASAPTTTWVAPTAAQVITATTTPTFQWTHNAGADGGAQTAYQIVVAEKVVASAGGYDPLTGATVWSPGITAGSTATVVCGTNLTNGTVYRAFIRSAQTINGAYQWPTSWATVDFTISVTPPATPTLTATLQASSGRVQLVMTTSTAASALAYWEVQASTDAGTTWSRTVRGDLSTGDGFILASSNSLTRHDYEIAVDAATVYRARVTSTTLGSPVTSAWSSTTSSATWTPTALWIKCPSAPALNISGLRAKLLEPERRRGRAEVLFPIGRTDALVITDARGPIESTLQVLTESRANRTALTAVLNRQEPLLLQGPASWELDTFASVLDTDRVRVVKIPSQLDRYESLAYVATSRPSPAIPVASWPA